jgi:predicted transcriptional regulator
LVLLLFEGCILLKLKDVKEILEAEIISGEELLDIEVVSACGCDLMSDVLSFAKEEAILLTGLINSQVVRTAEMMDMRAIVFVRGKMPGIDIIELAKNKNIVIMTTKHPLYKACGLLYKLGLDG